MPFDTKFKDVLTALKTQLALDFSTYSVHIGIQSDEGPSNIDISIVPGNGITDGKTGLWRYPIQIYVKRHGTAHKAEDMAQTAGEVLEKIQVFFAANNTEPLTTTTYWARVVTITPINNMSERGYYSEYILTILCYLYQPEFGTMGTVRFQYTTYDVTISVAVDVGYSIQRPSIDFAVTGNRLPSGIDRRSQYRDFTISGILIGANARTDAKEIIDLMEEQFGKTSINNITMTFSGALATTFGATRQVAPAPGSSGKIRAIDGDQYLVRITNLIFREVRI